MMAMKKGPDRLLVMDFGEKLVYGNPEEVLRSEEVHKIYLGNEEE
jgi:ABC-type branched-subunit amino acid transport system ATPase component